MVILQKYKATNCKIINTGKVLAALLRPVSVC